MKKHKTYIPTYIIQLNFHPIQVEFSKMYMGKKKRNISYSYETYDSFIIVRVWLAFILTFWVNATNLLVLQRCVELNL